MYLFCSGLLDQLIQHLLEITLGVGFQLRAEGLGRRPILAQDMLADGELALLGKSGQGRVSRDSRGSGGVDVGGAVAQHFEAAELRLLAGEVLGEHHSLNGVGALGVHAQHLAAEEGTHLYLLTVAGKGRELRGGEVVAQLLLDAGGGPGAADAGADVVADAALQHAVVAGDEGGIVAEGADRLGSSEAVGVIEVADLVAVGIQRELAAVAQEEGSQIPAVGDIHVNLLPGRRWPRPAGRRVSSRRPR